MALRPTDGLPEVPRPARPSLRFTKIVVIVALAVYVGTAVEGGRSKMPWWDEAWFAGPAWNLATTGSMGTPVLKPSGWRAGIDRYTYWVMPLYLITLAGWFKLAGFSLMAARSLSIVWGLVALVSWFFIMKALSGDNRVASLTVVLIALDYDFVMSASEARMDLMAAALGFAGLATYLTLRKKNLTRALVVASVLIAASGLTHPNGVLAFLGLCALALYLDRREITINQLMRSAVPHVLAAASWGFYVMQNPAMFWTQFHGNASDRFNGLTSPVLALKREVGRYIHYYAFGPHWERLPSGFWAGPSESFPVFILVIYAAAVLGALFNRTIREHRGYRALLILMSVYQLSLIFFDGHKRYYYIVYMIPLYAATLAACLVRYSEERSWHGVPAVVVGVVFIGLNLAATVRVIRRDSYDRIYMPVVDFVRRNSGENRFVIGSAELGFQLGFDRRLVDDAKIDYEAGGRVPDLIVAGWRYRDLEEDFSGVVADRLERNFREVYRVGGYAIYAPR